VGNFTNSIMVPAVPDTRELRDDNTFLAKYNELPAILKVRYGLNLNQGADNVEWDNAPSEAR
jgi:hypothetical protein